MRLISSVLSFSPRMRCTSRRSSSTGARSSWRAITSITSPTSVPPPEFENQFGDAVRRSDSRFEIRAALKAMRSVGMQTVPLRHPAHRDRIPPRGFDQDVLRLLRDHGVEAAHHAGQSDWLFRVGNDEVFGGQLALHAIQRLQVLAGPRFANDQPPAFEQIEIEHVRGLAALPQNVVGGIDGVADGPLIEQLQTLGNMRAAMA